MNCFNYEASRELFDCPLNEVMTNLASLVATSAAINSSFGRVSCLIGATRVLAMTKDV